MGVEGGALATSSRGVNCGRGVVVGGGGVKISFSLVSDAEGWGWGWGEGGGGGAGETAENLSAWEQ